MRLKKTLAMILAMAMVLTALSGCAGQATTANPSVTDTAAPADNTDAQTSSTAEVTTDQPEKHVRVYSNRGESAAAYKIWNGIIEQYQKEVNPNFTVEWESETSHDQYLNKLKLYIAGNDLPTIFQLDQGTISAELIHQGKLVNIKDTLQSIDMFDKYNPACVAYVSEADGGMYMLPEARYCDMFVYWKGIFKQYGLEEPKTLDDFLHICEVLNQNGVAPVAVSGKDSWSTLEYMYMVPWRVTFNGFINKIKTGEIKFEDDPIGVKATNFLSTMGKYFPKGFSNIDFTDAVNSFMGKNAGMLLTYTSMMSQLEEDYANGELGYFPIPQIDGYENPATNLPVHTGKAWAFNAEEFDPEMQRFFQYLVTHYNDACYANGVHSPLDLGIPEESSPMMKDLYEDLSKQEFCWVAWEAQLDPATGTLIGELGVELAMGMITPEEFMKEIDQSIEENAGEYFN